MVMETSCIMFQGRYLVSRALGLLMDTYTVRSESSRKYLYVLIVKFFTKENYFRLVQIGNFCSDESDMSFVEHLVAKL